MLYERSFNVFIDHEPNCNVIWTLINYVIWAFKNNDQVTFYKCSKLTFFNITKNRELSIPAVRLIDAGKIPLNVNSHSTSI